MVFCFINIKFFFIIQIFLTMIINSFPLHAIYIEFICMLNTENSINAVSAAYSSFWAIHRILCRAVAILLICRCHLGRLWEVAWWEKNFVENETKKNWNQHKPGGVPELCDCWWTCFAFSAALLRTILGW